MSFYENIDVPKSSNRLMVVDWASLAYHQWHAMHSKLNKSNYFTDVITSEHELEVWRSSMMMKMMDYIKLFNPIDIVISLEGNKLWRSDFVKEWYDTRVDVYFDDTYMYVKFDNFLYKVYKSVDGYVSEKMDIIADMPRVKLLKYKKLAELPDRVKHILWDTCLPKYKGTRIKGEWNFMTDKKVWREYKETFAVQASKVFRAYVIGHDRAEGDDVIYTAINYMGKNYNDIVLVTRDSDMTQLLTNQKLRIYNHVNNEMVVHSNPTAFIEAKILSGDKADNVNGMALPLKKTQLGVAGANKLLESVGNIYQHAIDGGWDQQYLRNQKLIHLNYIPTDIQREIVDIIDNFKPEMSDIEYLYDLGIRDKLVQYIEAMKNVGYYVVNTKEYIEQNPDLFELRGNQFKDSLEQRYLEAIEPQRTFDIDGVFNDPLADDDDDLSKLF